MSKLTVALSAGHWLDIALSPTSTPERRQMTEADFVRFEEWSRRYRAALGESDQRRALLDIGCEMHAWLDGDSRVLGELVKTSLVPPLVVEFAVTREPDDHESGFLEAPWELVATGLEHWALSDTKLYCPVRRLGKSAPTEIPPPSPHRLRAVFMASAPEGLGERQLLDYEAEEAAILKATEQTGVEFVVEESGTLARLKATVAREAPEVVHLSCHGRLEPEPCLMLEDELGEASYATLDDLRELAGCSFRLLFLSACETAKPSGLVESICRALVLRGAPAVLGWAGSVRDLAATRFAASFYGRLTAGQELVAAVARARLDLAEAKEVGDQGANDWHLARLFLGPRGGGSLAMARGSRRHLARGRVYKAFLDTKGEHVPVAGEFEFVGRRRQLQKVLREFRPDTPAHAGVLIHGLGRQGKSSLAARLAHRLLPTHELVVVYGRYEAPFILECFRAATGWRAVTELVERHRLAVASDPGNLFEALVEILEGPCRQEEKDVQGRLIARPALVVVDDLEQVLEAQPQGKHRFQPAAGAAMTALIKAFDRADTQSRLLLTSRYQFALREDAADLADRLLELDLAPMQEFESRKQAAAKERAQSTALDPAKENALSQRLSQIIGGGGGESRLAGPAVLPMSNRSRRLRPLPGADVLLPGVGPIAGASAGAGISGELGPSVADQAADRSPARTPPRLDAI